MSIVQFLIKRHLNAVSHLSAIFEMGSKIFYQFCMAAAVFITFTSSPVFAEEKLTLAMECAVIRDLNILIISDRASNGGRIMEIINRIDQAGIVDVD